MNWTGGKLQRQMKWGKTQQSEQKQHFASVRTKLQNGDNDPASFVPSFMQIPSVNRAHALGQIGRPTRARQKVLEEYELVAPVVDRLKFMTPRRQGTKRNRTGAQGVSNRRSSSMRSDGIEAGVKHIGLEDVNSETFENEQQHIHDADVARDEAETRNALQELTTNDLAAQRRRLLDRPDWLGLNSTTHLHLDFVSDRGKEPVAKRRKITQADKIRHEEQQRLRRRVPSIQDEYMMRGALAPRNTIDDGSIKIKIGDAAFVSQTDAMSQARAPAGRAAMQSFEPMLLDEDADLPQNPAGKSKFIGKSPEFPPAAAQTELVHNFKAQHDTASDDSERAELNTVRETPPPSSPSATVSLPMSSSSESSLAAPTQKAVRGSIKSKDSNVSTFRINVGNEAGNLTQEEEQDWRNLLDMHSQRGVASSVAGHTTTDTKTAPETQRTSSVTNPLEVRSAKPVPPVRSHAMEVTRPKAAAPREPEAATAQYGKPKKDTAHAKKLDPDAAWKAFVFDDGEGENDDSDMELPSSVGKAVTATVSPTYRTKPKLHEGAKRTVACQTSSSSLLTSPTGAEPPTSPRQMGLPKEGFARPPVGSPRSSSFPYDRPSSLANASTTGTVLNIRRKV